MEKTKQKKLPEGLFRRSVALFLLLAMLLSVIPAPTVKAADDGVMVTGTGDSGTFSTPLEKTGGLYQTLSGKIQFFSGFFQSFLLLFDGRKWYNGITMAHSVDCGYNRY